MPDDQPDATEDRQEATQRLIAVCKTNADAITTLAGRGAGLSPIAMNHERLELVLDLLFGPFDPDDLDTVPDARLSYELAWAERLRKIVGQAMIETAGKGGQIAVPTPGLIIPDNGKGKRRG